MKCIVRNCDKKATHKVIVQDKKTGSLLEFCEKHWLACKNIIDNMDLEGI